MFQTCKNDRHHLLPLLQKCRGQKEVKQIHAQIIKSNLAAATQLFAFCATSGDVALFHYARSLFQQIPKNTFTWNTMIRSYANSDTPESAIFCYLDMLKKGYPVNNYTFPALVNTCALFPSPELGRRVHTHIAITGFDSDEFVKSALIHMYSANLNMESARKLFDKSTHGRDVVIWTAMVDGYAKSGNLDEARRLFDEMPERNVVSWSAMIAGYSRANLFKQALELFQNMLEAKTMPNESTLVSLLSACAHLGALAQGQWLHSFMERNRYKLNVILGTALADMYAKCGCVELALSVFDKIPKKDAGSWNAIISGLAMNGDAKSAIELLSRMQITGVQPNEVTFISILSACTHGGFVRDGLRLFRSMTSVYGIEPRVEHYACVVDLLGRAGFLEEAEKLVEMGKLVIDLNVWGALLGSCRIHGNVEVGDRVGKKLIELGIADCGTYVLLYNIYSEAGWDRDANRVRKLITEEGLKKKPGCSSIEVNGRVYEFLAGDLSNPQWRETWEIVDSLSRVLKLRY